MDSATSATNAYLLYKKRDYAGCMNLLTGKYVDKDCIGVKHNCRVVSFLKEESHDYDTLLKDLIDLLNKARSEKSEINGKSALSEESLIYVMKRMYTTALEYIHKVVDELKGVYSSVLIRCYLLSIEIYFSLYRIQGEAKEWLHLKCFPLFSQIELIMSKEKFPDFINYRLLFRYHIYRSLYFLEQGSVKGVKKEVKASSDCYLMFSEDSADDYDHQILSLSSSSSMSTLVLDSYDVISPYDGYLSPLLKTRLEYRRGNCLKILSVLSQVYEECSEDKALLKDTTNDVTPLKDYFYYSMMSNVYSASGMMSLSLHYMNKALIDAQDRHVDGVTIGIILKNLGVLHANLDDFISASQCLRQAISFLPQSPPLWFRYAEVCYQQGAALAPCATQVEPLGGDIALRDNPLLVTHGGLHTVTKTSVSPERQRMLTEAKMAFSTTVDLLQKRGGGPSSLQVLCLARQASICLDTCQYASCIDLCVSAQQVAVKVVPSVDDMISMSSIQAVLMLYKAEALMQVGRLDEAISELDPVYHPTFYCDTVVIVSKKPELFGDIQNEIEKFIKDGSLPYMESMIYNLSIESDIWW